MHSIMKKTLLLCSILWLCLPCTVTLAQKSPKGTAGIELSYYLPKTYTYNPSVPTPKSFLGYEVGEWTIDYGQLIRYFEALAKSSPRVTLEEFGKSHENRPQIVLTITAPNNHSKISSIQKDRQKLRDARVSLNYAEMPVVLNMGYTVHGNEASGINSAVLAAYHFAAANEVEKDLENIIILIDPLLNPDGYARYSTWVNSHRSMNLNGDANQRELSEAWPGGRGNHYWFDLNRDWLLVQHPESKNRVAHFQSWLPNIYLDFHEMGTNTTFFFQPAIPSRDHPLIPKNIVEMTKKMATFHAKEFDQTKGLYFAKERFDEYYFGYGSTYPDIQGSVGILFEQASSRGHLQESDFGMLTFAHTVRNQFKAALSSFAAAATLKGEFNQLTHDFYKEAAKLASADADKAYIFGANNDAARSYHLVDILRQHQINVLELKEDLTVNGVAYKSGKSYIVPTDQAQYRLIKAMFEVRNEFNDSLFYDVSAWTMPMSFNLNYAALSSKTLPLAKTSPIPSDFRMKAGMVIGQEDAVAYALPWEDYYAPKAAYALITKGYLVRVATEEMSISTGKKLQRGSLLVGLKKDAPFSDWKKLEEDIKEIALSAGIDVHKISTGYTSDYDIGSPTLPVLKKPEVALLVSTGVNSLEAGEIWHLLDRHMDMAITLLPAERLAGTDLSKYNVLVIPSGSYGGLGKAQADKIKAWVSQGNTLIGRGSAMRWMNEHGIATFKFKEEEANKKEAPKPYADYEKNTGARLTSGTIFHGKIDTTHPLGYGYDNEKIYLFRNNNQFLELANNAYANPVVYTHSPLASGYVHPENVEKIKNTASTQVKKVGAGRVIGMVDNPNFRGIWFGTNKLFLNAIFFGQIIQGGTAD
jgi:hypothetical protein